jgi:hypothetical protein
MPDTRLLSGPDPLRQGQRGPRLAIDNTGGIEALEAERQAALDAYNEACRNRALAGEQVINALRRILQARVALDRACGRRPRCE